MVNIKNYITFCMRYCDALLHQLLFKKEKYALVEEWIEKGPNSIPVFIISFNRLSYLRQFISQLEFYGIKNIHIIDNASTYQPLLDYYKTLPYEIIRENTNMGHNVFWLDDQFKKYRDDFYIVTDPDLRIIDECPGDFLSVFLKMIKKYPFARKVGFSLKIDDLPENGIMTKEVKMWEEQFNRVYIKKDNVYHARIDTTFALYVPEQFAVGKNPLVGLRTGLPYQMRHLPWYKVNDSITDEDLFYTDSKKNGWFDPVTGFKPDEGIEI